MLGDQCDLLGTRAAPNREPIAIPQEEAAYDGGWRLSDGDPLAGTLVAAIRAGEVESLVVLKFLTSIEGLLW
jgi:hypothetical protein